MEMVGLQPTKADIMAAAGSSALIIKREYEKCVSMNAFILRMGDPALIAIGFTQPELDILKPALADLAFQKGSAFDSSTPIKQIYGLGI